MSINSSLPTPLKSAHCILIFLSVGWGLLFALGGMAIFRNNVSIIVIGISSVILGIAVNYPLHLIAHISHKGDKRLSVSEILSPLVIGNITTVGAFLSLVPLRSVALRDLGIFASLLLVGTILFVLVYLPHLVKMSPAQERKSKWIDRLAGVSPEKYRPVVLAVVVLTAVLAVFSFGTKFDSNLSNINYMTREQRGDMQYFESLVSRDTASSVKTVYALSSGMDMAEAVEANVAVRRVADSLVKCGKVRSHRGISRFLVSQCEQAERLRAWAGFVSSHADELGPVLEREASYAGFSKGAFGGFSTLVAEAGNLVPQSPDFFAPLMETTLRENFTSLKDPSRSYVIDILGVDEGNVPEVEACFVNSFDVSGVNGALSRTLSDNFNYIGWACSLIVFFFLWFSFGSVELALISFLPMAISWIWILGLMALFGIKFNIVNVILATFIFGQGDDYTIFMTEGCQYEYTYHRPIMASYKSSILQSALIMFVGIGTLIVARHPAMRSLAEVTIVGMFSVVLMAWMVPSLLFSFLTTKDGRQREHPITFRTLLQGEPLSPSLRVRGRYIYKGKEISRTVKRNLRLHGAETEAVSVPPGGQVEFRDCGYGELALLMALTHPEARVKALLADENRKRIAEVSAEGFVSNIEFSLIPNDDERPD